ncbi:recombinase family protein [Polaromonas glacialis]
MRVSIADGSQALDLQLDALVAAAVASSHIYADRASGRKDDRPGLRWDTSYSAPICATCRAAFSASSIPQMASLRRWANAHWESVAAQMLDSLEAFRRTAAGGALRSAAQTA